MLLKKLPLLIFLIFTMSYGLIAQAYQEPDGHWVGGYYANWSYWRGGGSIKSLDAIKSTAGAANFITYAFLGVTTSNTLKNQLPLYGGILLSPQQQGEPGTLVDPEALAENSTINTCPAYPDDISACVSSKVTSYLQNYTASDNQKTILMASIGGWSYTSRFSDFYQDYKKDPTVLTRFINSTENWLRGHLTFTGIDLNWEYPGYGHAHTLDKNHAGECGLYAKMLSKLRTMLNDLGTEQGKHYYLTTTIVASITKAKGETSQGVNWKTIANYVDWFNLMAFERHGEFGAAHPKNKARALSMSSPTDLQPVISYYISHGIKSNKILLGIPAYAREMLIAQRPTQANQYGYNGNLHYSNYKNYFNAFKTEYYQNNDNYYKYQDNPNPEPHYPVGGMVDFTGAYDYQCFLSAITQGKAQNNCNVLNSLDNRGMIGQSLPENLVLSYPSPGVAWLSGNQQNIAANFVGSPSKLYPAYPVFTMDTQATVSYKIKHLVNKNKLGGIWFWELSEDALKSPQFSLFVQACKDLNKNGKCISAAIPASAVQPGKCLIGDNHCVELSNNSGHYSDHYTLSCNTTGLSYDFANMRGGCNDANNCVKHISLQNCKAFTINPTNRGVCSKIPFSQQGSITCDVNTLTL